MPDEKSFLSCAWSDYLTKAIKDYHEFSTHTTPMEAKDFALYHNACKAALGHIALIQKLMPQKEEKAEEPNLFDLLEQARKATNDPDEDDSFD